jgi:WD40 repeat protein
MTDVFLSYCRRNKDFVLRLHQRLVQDGKTLWVDWEDIPPNADWRQEIAEGIQKANTVVFVLSPEWLASYECNVELEQAVALNKRLLPIVCQDVQYKEVAPSLAALNWIFFRENDDFESAYQALMTALDTDLGHVKYHTKLLARSIEWDKRERDPSLLLQGGVLVEAETWLTTSQGKTPLPTQLQSEYVITSSQRRSQRQKFTIIGATAGFVIACGLAITAFAQYQVAERQRRQVEELQTATLSETANATFAIHDQLRGLLASTKANLQLQQLTWLTADEARSQDMEANLRTLFQAIRERNRLEDHNDLITNLHVSRDGQIISSTSADNTIKLWRPDGSLITTLEGHEGTVWTAIFSRDQQRIASSSEDGTIRLWTPDGDLLNTLTYDATIWSVDFNEAGDRLAVAAADSMIRILDLEGNVQTQWQVGDDTIFSIRFSPDGQRLISGSGDNIARLWDLEGNLLQTFDGHGGEIWAVRFSPDGQQVATASADDTIRLWSLDGTLIRQLTGHTSGVISINYNEDGTRLVSAGADHTVRVWVTSSGLLLNTFRHLDIASGAAFLSDTQVVSGSYDKTVRIWEYASSLEQNLDGHSRRVLDVAVSGDSNTLASTSSDATIRIWAKGDTAFTPVLSLAQERGEPMAVALDESGELIVVGGSKGELTWWNRQGERLHTVESAHGREVMSVAISPDGQWIASAGNDRLVRIWTRSGELVRSLSGHLEGVRAVAFSPDGRFLASGGSDNTVRLWALGGELLQVLDGHEAGVYDVAFSPDGEQLVSGSMDETIIRWSVDGTLLTQIRGNRAGITSVGFSPDGQMIASGSFDNSVKLWTLEGVLLRILDGHQQRVSAVTFSPSGEFLVSAAADRRVKLWDITQVGSIPVTREALIQQSCEWLNNYLQHNRNVEDRDRDLCRSQSTIGILD